MIDISVNFKKERKRLLNRPVARWPWGCGVWSFHDQLSLPGLFLAVSYVRYFHQQTVTTMVLLYG